MKTEISLTKWKIPLLLCWIGLVGMVVQIYAGTLTSLWLSVSALFVSGIGISIGGPLKTIKTKIVDLEQPDKD